MAAIADQPVTEVEQAPDKFYRPRPKRVTLSDEQQQVFNKAWSKREARLRRQFEQMRVDLLETAGLCDQLLQRCKDRLSAEDARSISMGLNAIKIEHRLKIQEKSECQTQ